MRPWSILLITTSSVFCSCSTANAQASAVFIREQIATLPAHRFMVSVVGVNASLDTTYGRDGVSSPVSNRFQQNISFNKVAEEEPIRGNQLAGMFASNGVALDDSAGEVKGSFNGVMNVKVPVIGYGITDQVGIYLSAPIVNFQVRTNYQFKESNQTKAFYEKLKSAEQNTVVEEFRSAFSASLENKLFKAGYNWNPELNRSYLGDIQLSLAYVPDVSPFRGYRQMIQPFLLLPTASDRDIHDLFGLKAGDDRLGIGSKYSLETKLNSVQVNFSVQGTYLFPNTQDRRLPKNIDDELNEYLAENSRVSGGNRLQGQVQLRYSLPHWASLNLGALWQRKYNESILGESFSEINYQLAEDRSNYELLSSYASIDLNSIESFLNGSFLFPGSVELGLGLPLRGRNAIAEPTVQFQGSLFF